MYEQQKNFGQLLEFWKNLETISSMRNLETYKENIIPINKTIQPMSIVQDTGKIDEMNIITPNSNNQQKNTLQESSIKNKKATNTKKRKPKNKTNARTKKKNKQKPRQEIKPTKLFLKYNETRLIKAHALGAKFIRKSKFIGHLEFLANLAKIQAKSNTRAIENIERQAKCLDNLPGCNKKKEKTGSRVERLIIETAKPINNTTKELSSYVVERPMVKAKSVFSVVELVKLFNEKSRYM
ncbi:hypothetical protein CDIK_2483 [Cucumispora dikerogammari]|nr:hypothetical protein CDIK_2483 [Cucumispora dikerogammari]